MVDMVPAVASNADDEVKRQIRALQTMMQDLPDEMRGSTEHLIWRLEAGRRQQAWLELQEEFIPLDAQMMLQNKIAFALNGYGAGIKNDYTPEQYKIAKEFADKLIEICKKKHLDGVYLSILFVYCYVKRTKVIRPQEFTEVVFRVGKGDKNVEFVDSRMRVYDSWTQFRNENRIDKCEYALPQDGRYAAGEDGKVLITLEESPNNRFLSRQIGEAVGNICKYSLWGGLAATGLGGFGVLSATMSSGLVTAGLCMTGTGGAVGAGLNVATLVDRGVHQQSLSLRDPKARAEWIKLALNATTAVASGYVLYNSLTATAEVCTQEVVESQATSFASNIKLVSSVGEQVYSLVLDPERSPLSPRNRELLQHLLILWSSYRNETLSSEHWMHFGQFLAFYCNEWFEENREFVCLLSEGFKDLVYAYLERVYNTGHFVEQNLQTIVMKHVNSHHIGRFVMQAN